MRRDAAERAPRGFRGDGDLKQIVALLAAAWSSYGAQTYCRVGDVLWRMRMEAWEERLGLWEDATGQLAALTTFEPPDEFEFQIHPSHHRAQTLARILTWGEEQAQRAAEGSDLPP